MNFLKNFANPKFLANKSVNNFSSLVIGESKNGKLNKSFYKIINAAQEFKQDTDIVISGENLSEAVSHIQSTVSNSFIKKIFVADSAQLKGNCADRVDQVLVNLIKEQGYSQIIADSSSFGKDILPRVAVQFDSQAITDITNIIDDNTFKRPVYAGNAIATVRSSDPIKFLSFRATSFESISQDNVQNIETVQNIEIQLQRDNLSQFVSEDIVVSERPELTSARNVISGGRALKNSENFKLLEELGDAFGNSAIGASRAAVDAGYVSNDLQVGQTGKVVAPELYVAIGISGAIQHVAGMKDSKVIVAINKDGECPIFDIATYGLVGDLFKIVPELTQKLNALK